MQGQGVTCLSFSRDGTQVASGSFDTVGRVHGLKSGKALKELRGHTSYINEVRAVVRAPSPSPSPSPSPKPSSPSSPSSPSHESGSSTQIVFAPDAARLVTGSSDGSVRVWDAKTCDCLHNFRPPAPTSAERA